MALFLKQDDNRTEFQQKIAAELREKIKNKPKDTDAPDGIDDSKYIEGTKKTTSLAWVWILIVAAIIAIVIRYMTITLK